VERSRPLDGMTPPPRCGEDTRDVLKTKLNLTDDELTRLEQEGVIPQCML